MSSIVGSLLVLQVAPVLNASSVQLAEPSATLTLEGVVLDPAGEPVEGAIVWHDRARLEPHSFPPDRERVFSDATGQFTLAYPDIRTSRRELFVHVFKEGFPITNLATRVGTEHVVVQLETPQYIEGTVRDESGEPLQDVTVLAERIGERSPYDWPAGPISASRADKVRTTREGRYSFPAADGQWRVAFAKEGYVAEGIEDVEPGGGPLAVTLHRGVNLCGNVSSSDGAGVENVSLGIQDRLHNLNERTGEDGRFCFTGVAPGTRSIWLHNEGLTLTRKVEVGKDVEVTLNLPPYGTVSGTVTDSDGTAIPGAKVDIRSHSPEHRFSWHARTDAAGTFSADVPVGDVKLRAWAPDLVPYWSEARSITNQEVHEHEISLRRGSTLRGRITDQSGIPLEAHVRAQRHGPEADSSHFYELSAMTDDEGNFVIPQIGPGAREVIVSATCCLERKVVIAFENGVDEVLDLTLDRGYEIAGRVVGADGQPLANRGLRAFLMSEKEQTGKYGATDAHGKYRFTGLPDGMWRIELEDDEHYAAAVSVRAGEAAPDLVADRGGIIEGVISGLDERAFVMAYRSVEGEDRRVRVTTVDEGGTYELRGLPDGTIHLMLEVPNRYGYVMGTVDVAAPHKYSFDHDLRLVHRVAGRVVINGEPRPNLRMYWWEDGSRRKAATSEGGMLDAPLLTNGCKWVTVTSGQELGLLRKRINVVADEFHLEIEGAPMTIDVVDSAGARVDGATISFRSVNCEARQDRDYVTKEGVATIPFVPFGPFRVQVKIGDRMTETAGVHAAGDGDVTRLTLRLPFER